MDSSPEEPLVAYSLPQYLLDRINIHDTITRLVSNRPTLLWKYYRDTGCTFCNSRHILTAEILSALEMKSLPPRRSL